MPPAMTPARARVGGYDLLPLDSGWEVASAPPDAVLAADQLNNLDWIPAQVPGTAAGALREAGRPVADLDALDWWFRTTFETSPPAAGEEIQLCLAGIATTAEVFLNGEPIAASESMFASRAVDIGRQLRATNQLTIRCRAITPQLAVQRSPRARWRTRLVADNSLRWFRAMLLGRVPGFSPGPPAIGPWRPIWLERRAVVAVDALEVRTRLDGEDGILTVHARLRGLDGPIPGPIVLELDGPSGQHRVALETRPDGLDISADGQLRIPAVARWWPHTHGEPVLHDVRLRVGPVGEAIAIEAGRVGFRSLAPGAAAEHEIERDGLFLHVNGVPVFARGALWTPLDIVGMAPSEGELRAAIETVRAAGMNMLRLPGFGAYEQKAFHDLCDELGVMVWQDLMYMSMDYPFTDEAFGRLARAEVAQLLAELGGRPSLMVICGSSEVEQQVAMLGLDLALARIPFFDHVVPDMIEAAGVDAVYVPSAPFGGDLPMRPDRGVTGYYGVGGYRAPLSDARTSGVLFAAECLAFANVPDDEALASLVPEPPYEPFVHNPRWKAGVARDAGAGWDFDDLRDYYFEMLYRIDPHILRRGNPDRYLELSRAVTGEVMELVYGEWRRAGSPSGGGLILWLRDLVPGAGWGVVDNLGRPKAAYHHLRRILAPTAVWLVDEGIGGVIAHVANDGPKPLTARLRIGLYSDLELPVGMAEEEVSVPAHGTIQRDVESVIGHFVDASWAYRFGPPAQDAIVASLEGSHEGTGDAGPAGLLSQAFHFPAGRPLNPEPEQRLGLAGVAGQDADGSVTLAITSRRLAYGVRIHVAGYAPGDDAFSVEPGLTRTIRLLPEGPGSSFSGGWLTALNLVGRVVIRPSEQAS
jgi:beta-mannosidase